MKIDIQTIEQYLLGELTPDEKSAFEKALATDEKLQQKLDQQKAIQAGIRRFSRSQLKKELNSIHQNYIKENNTASQTEIKKAAKRRILPFSRQTLSIAAGFLILVAAATFILFPRPSSPATLFGDYYAPYQINLQKGPSSDKAKLNNAKDFYINKNYAAAYTSVTQYLQSNPEDAEALLIKGICQMETGQYRAAANTFSGIDNPLFREQALWYQALNELKNEQLEASRTLLKKGLAQNIFSAKLKQKAEKLVNELE